MTSGGIRLGAVCWNQHTSWEALLAAGVRVDELGYQSLWTWDHVYPIIGDLVGPDVCLILCRTSAVFQSAWPGPLGWVVSMVGAALLAGSGHAVTTGGSHGSAFAAVFLSGCDVADPGVKADLVVVLALSFELSAEHVDVAKVMSLVKLDRAPALSVRDGIVTQPRQRGTTSG